MESHQLNPLEITILKILEPHEGERNKISRESLVEAVNCDRPLFPVGEREIRKIIKHLIQQEGFAIGSRGGKNGGYYICETPEEIKRVAKYFEGIGLCSFYTASKLLKIGMRDYMGQLSIKFS